MKKLDQKKNKDHEENKWKKIMKNGNVNGLILKLIKKKYYNVNGIINIGNVKRMGNGQKIYLIYFNKFIYNDKINIWNFNT